MSNKTFYIGVATTYHDPAIAIVDETGDVLFSEATERYIQNKRAIGCMAETGYRIPALIEEFCRPDGSFVIADTWSQRYRWLAQGLKASRFSTPKKLLTCDQASLSGSILDEYEAHYMFNMQAVALQQFGLGSIVQMRRHFPHANIEIRHHNHHLTHAYNACYSSSFVDAACLIVDGFGETGSVSLFHFDGHHLKTVKNYASPASLGFFYMMMTKLCGFNPEKGEEWKVMGLAPYGKLHRDAYEILKKMISVQGYNIKYCKKADLIRYYNELKLYGRQPGEGSLASADLAFTAQMLFSEWLTEIIRNVHKTGLSERLVLGGGCALNSAYVGKLTKLSGFSAVHVPSAPADDGNALGAAWASWRQDQPQLERRRAKVLSPYLGSRVDQKTLDNLLAFGGLHNIRRFPDSIQRETANLLAQGKLVAVMQGRAEFGPRALGNRSILADPRSDSMKEIINARIKFREEFRPFAPAILDEHGDAYFHDYQYSPYMERTLVFREDVRSKVPAVVHQDFTGRVQSVTDELNPYFAKLLREFFDLTSIPILLNTSFNVMGKPIVHSIEDALAVFFTSGLDALVIEDYLIQK